MALRFLFTPIPTFMSAALKGAVTHMHAALGFFQNQLYRWKASFMSAGVVVSRYFSSTLPPMLAISRRCLVFGTACCGCRWQMARKYPKAIFLTDGLNLT